MINLIQIVGSTTGYGGNNLGLGYKHLAAGLCCGLSSLAAGLAIGIVGGNNILLLIILLN